jgi:nucleotide-binding universal stress UspA family protein
MVRVVLVPLDTSSFAEQALPHAIALAQRADAELHLVCFRASLPPDFAGMPNEEVYLARIAAQLEPELRHAISHAVLVDELGPLYPTPTSTCVADALSRYAREHGADFIVMATHGRGGGVRRAWPGSVADSLIRSASLPVLLIRPHDRAFGSAISADRGIRHIVIPVDGSDTAGQMIPYALKLGSAFDARYSLVRVISPLSWDSYAPVWGPEPPLIRLAIAEYLEGLASSLREHGCTVATRVLDAFSPGPAIVQFAETYAGDAIALSTTGAGRVRRLLLGSVTDSVVRNSKVPVLVGNIRRLGVVTEAEDEAASAAAECASR